MESEKFICVRETGAANSVVIVDMENPSQPMKGAACADVTSSFPRGSALGRDANARGV